MSSDLNRPFLMLKKVATACTTEKSKGTLQKKYDTEEGGLKKYAVNRYLRYQMTDEKFMEAQSHEIQKIAHEIISEGMPLDDQFQVAVIIDKLPPLWKDFKNTLRHKTKDFPFVPQPIHPAIVVLPLLYQLQNLNMLCIGNRSAITAMFHDKMISLLTR
ncbi:uncharacterized protein E6C27_scaffold74G002950 [Cucumis melo var. makuwa]|uniref:Uncharacterized protein n=1 Tax=Cucumis melo var. makuwa TaxID=1194695 RepID=A0A5A7TS67_CUCMM|nr:uncharacterized protein E6C27_scaffold74G002950 [Cucumis melo var. makuwa]